MKIDILLGLQWGDEGKGKIVDALSPSNSIMSNMFFILYRLVYFTAIS
jgi:adenylosuccinate synthase